MFEITVDARELAQPNFMLAGVEGLLEGHVLVQVQLPAGVHRVEPAAGAAAAFEFEVLADGVVDYAADHAAFLGGRGTSLLRIKGLPVMIDGTALLHDLFPSGLWAGSLSRDRAHVLTLLPGVGYGFQLIADGTTSELRFDVTPVGELRVDSLFAEAATVAGSKLTLHGHRITVDGRQLSHDLLLAVLGLRQVLNRHQLHNVSLLPGRGYRFQLVADGTISDLRFDVGTKGELRVHPSSTGAATAAGSTLTLHGHRITIDGRQLSHDVVPLAVFGMTEILGRDRTHDLRFLPARGYRFQLIADGTASDLRFDVDPVGKVRLDLWSAGAATAAGSTLTLHGHRITIDGRQLSHDLRPLAVFGMSGILGRDRNHDLNLLPARGYRFQLMDDGTASDLRFDVDPTGLVRVDRSFVGFAAAAGSTLTLHGYRVIVDGRQLSRDLLFVALLGVTGVLSRDRAHELTLLPANSFALSDDPASDNQFRFRLDATGRIASLNLPADLHITRPSEDTAGREPAGLAFVNWMTADDRFALGRLHGHVVSLAGRLGDGAVVDNSSPLFDSPAFTPALHQSDSAYVVVAPLDSPDAHIFTLMFGASIRDPVLHLHSLGSTLFFAPGTDLRRVSGGDRFTVSGTTISGGGEGTDSSGTAVVEGTFSQLSFEARPNFTGGSSVDGVYLQVGGWAE